MNRILVVEDEDVIRKQIARLLERHEYEVVGAANVEDALSHKPESFDVILADIRLPGPNGNEILDYSEHVPVIMMTSYASVRSAVESMKLGASDYISKPFDHEELLITIERSLRENRLSAQNAAMRRELNRLYPQVEVESDHEVMQETIEGLKTLTKDDHFVYLCGERGTGKERLARLSHEHSDRNRGPLVFADLPMYDADSIDFNIFGSQSDQQRSSSGLLQVAHGGTLVVRSIGEMSLDSQLELANRLVDARNKTRVPNVRLVVLTRDPPEVASFVAVARTA